jgi:hypothetical protein
MPFIELEIPYIGVNLLLSRVHCGARFASKVPHQSTLNHYRAFESAYGPKQAYVLEKSHNARPFERGKRANHSPAQLVGLTVPEDLLTLLGLAPKMSI